MLGLSDLDVLDAQLTPNDIMAPWLGPGERRAPLLRDPFYAVTDPLRAGENQTDRFVHFRQLADRANSFELIDTILEEYPNTSDESRVLLASENLNEMIERLAGSRFRWHS